MVGMHIGRYLPLTSRSHMDLLKPPPNKAGEEGLTLRRKRGGMKAERAVSKDDSATDGAHVMHVTHQVCASR